MSNQLSSIETEHLKMRPLLLEDMKFVYELRRSDRASQMKPISPNIEEQYGYFRNYQIRYENGEEIYFKIIEQRTGDQIGVVRLTDIKTPHCFGWESLITVPNCSGFLVIDIFCTIYTCGFEILNKNLCKPFPVPKQLTRVLDLHKRMGMAELVSEDEMFMYYQVTRDRYAQGIGPFAKRGFGRIRKMNDRHP